MRKLLALLLFALPLRAQTVANPSFEAPATLGQAGAAGPWSYGPVPSWTLTGSGGLWQPSALFALPVPDGSTILWLGKGSVTQDLGAPAQPNTIYTLTVWTGRRSDQWETPTNSYTISLSGGATILCTQSAQLSTIPVGTFTKQVLTCPVGATPPAGNLSVSLGCDGPQCAFDNLSLSSTSANPPILIKVNLVSKLLWCVLCDGTDDTPITGFLVVAQQQTSSTYGLGADGSFAYSVAINVAVDPVDFVFSLLDSAGKPVPGVHLEWIIPQIAIQSAPGWALGTLPLPAMRFARVTDAAGNPAVKFKGFAVGP